MSKCSASKTNAKVTERKYDGENKSREVLCYRKGRGLGVLDFAAPRTESAHLAFFQLLAALHTYCSCKLSPKSRHFPSHFHLTTIPSCSHSFEITPQKLSCFLLPLH
jgi:hypothetical protein